MAAAEGVSEAKDGTGRCEACESRAVLGAVRELKAALHELRMAESDVEMTLDRVVYADSVKDARLFVGWLDREEEFSFAAVQQAERAIARLKKAAATLRGACPP